MNLSGAEIKASSLELVEEGFRFGEEESREGEVKKG